MNDVGKNDSGNDFLIRCEEYMLLAEGVSPTKKLNKTYAYNIDYINADGAIYYSNGCAEEEEWKISAETKTSIHVYVRDNQTIKMEYVDNICYELSTHINAPQELSEIIYFIGNISNNDLDGYGNYKVRVGELIESVYITIPTKKGLKLWPFNQRSLNALPDDIKSEIMMVTTNEDKNGFLDLNRLTFNDDSWDDEVEDIINEASEELRPSSEMQDAFMKNCDELGITPEPRFYNDTTWMEYLEENDRYEYFTNLVDCCDRDIQFHSLDYIIGKKSIDSQPDRIPLLVFRVRSKYSAMYFSDYLKYSTEGKALSDEILRVRDGSEIPKKLTIEMPRKKAVQIQRSIELRYHISGYRDEVSRLIKWPDPIDGIIDRYKKRKDNLRFVHNEFLYELSEIRSPLPSMIEHPYRMFRRADALTKQKDSQHLLNLLIKIPLFYILEEVKVLLPELSKRYFDKIYSPKPLSDGALTDILKELIDDLVNNECEKLVVRGFK